MEKESACPLSSLCWVKNQRVKTAVKANALYANSNILNIEIATNQPTYKDKQTIRGWILPIQSTPLIGQFSFEFDKTCQT